MSQKSNLIHALHASTRANHHTIRLYRFGWFSLFFGVVNFLLFVCAVLVIAFKPPTILAVDQEGRLAGTIEYLNAQSRSNQEILTALRHFLSAKMSLNRETIFTDFSASLTMMSPELMEHELDLIKQQEAIERIQLSSVRSYLTFTNTTITARQREQFTAELSGTLNIGTKPYPFRVQITGTIIPRSQLNTFGVQINRYEDLEP